MFKWWRQYRTARKWQKRGRKLFLSRRGEVGWDCDEVSRALRLMMLEEGLKDHKDFVVVRCKATPSGERHMCLEMYGKNSTPSKINGYRVDSTYDGFIRDVWKAEYALLALLCLFLAGCGPTIAESARFDPSHEYADEDGFVPVAKVKLNKGGSCEALPDGSIKFDTRERSLFDKFITPLVSGASEKAEVPL